MHSADLPRVTLLGARLRQTLDVVAIALLVATEGPARVRELLTLGVPFDVDAAGAFLLALEAAHRRTRVANGCHQRAQVGAQCRQRQATQAIVGP